MKAIKRIFITLLILFLVLATAGFVLVYFYEEEVKKYVVTEINKQLVTEVEVKNISFSVFRKFPHASLDFSEVLIKEAVRSKIKDTLLYAGHVFFMFSLPDIISGNYAAKKIMIENGKMKIMIDKYGRGNYDILKSSSDTTASPVTVALEKVIFKNLLVSYINRAAGQDYLATVKEGSLSGLFSSKEYTLRSSLDLQVHHFLSDSIDFIPEKPALAEVEMKINTSSGSYLISKGTVEIAELLFNVSGKVLEVNEDFLLELSVNSDRADIESFLSLLPSEYEKYVEGYKSKGVMDFRMKLSGIWSTLEYPKTDITFRIQNGTLTSGEAPIPLTHIQLDGSYTNRKSKSQPVSRLEIRNLSGTFGEKAVNADFFLEDFSDPFLSLHASAELDLDNLRHFFPMDTLQELKGTMAVNANFEGKTRKLSKGSPGAYQSVKTSGTVLFTNVSFRLKENPLEFKDFGGDFGFRDNDLSVTGFRGSISETDFQLDGIFKNVIAYIFMEDQPVLAEASFYSRNMNLDELLQNYNASTESDTVYRLRFSPLMNADLKVDIGTLAFRKFSSSDIRGNIQLKNQVLSSPSLTISTMDGSMNLNGSVNASQGDSVLFACDATIEKINITKLFSQLENFGQTVLVERQLKGVLTATVQFASVWSSDLNVDLNKVYAKSSIKIDNGELIEFEPMLALSKFIKVSELRHIKFSTLTNQIEIKNQNIFFPTMDIRSNALNLTAAGAHSFENTVDYKLKILLSDLLGKNIKNNKTEFGEIEDDGLGKVTLYIAMKGPAGDPKFTWDRKAVAEKLEADLKGEKQTIKNVLREEFGWFKNDSTLKKQDALKKEAVQIEWGEEDTSQKEGVKKEIRRNSKTEERRKKAFSNPGGDVREE